MRCRSPRAKPPRLGGRFARARSTLGAPPADDHGEPAAVIPFPTRSTTMTESARSHSDSATASRGHASLHTPTDLPADATRDIAAAMNGILADVFTLYL